jgi:hypothetical protein
MSILLPDSTHYQTFVQTGSELQPDFDGGCPMRLLLSGIQIASLHCADVAHLLRQEDACGIYSYNSSPNGSF